MTYRRTFRFAGILLPALLLIAGMAQGEETPQATETAVAPTAEAVVPVPGPDADELCVQSDRSAADREQQQLLVEIFQDPQMIPFPGSCPNMRCDQAFHCGDECTVTGCAWPCGICIWTTGASCSGYCVCR